MPKKLILLVIGLTLAPFSWAVRPGYIGWAQEAHPDYSEDIFVSHLKEQKTYGANLVWIGHNNPGYVDKNKVEPGMSYAVYEALQDQKNPLYADAVAQTDAVRRLLEAARSQGFKAVLAIGYQIQMGPDWNKRHPDALRREHDGHLFSAGGPSASYLSADYQRDIQTYYQWIDREWVKPYKDVLLMLNLADEPHGGDYSSSAEAAFRSQTGLSWNDSGKTQEGIIQRGRFQNLYIAEYARWSAGVWKTIDPSIRVTMSFCGSHGRFTNFEPSIDAIFKSTPDNFDVTFDAFLIDNQPGDPIDGKHVAALTIFLRQVGALSQKYNKRVWLWPEANNWILSQWSTVKGNISDALFGVTLLRNMSDASGIHLGGLAVWNLDVKEQGLFRDTHPLTYDPQRMFEKISADFKTEPDPNLLRRDALIWIPESEADYLIGRKEYDYADRVYLLDVYAPLLEQGIIPELSSDNSPSFEQFKTVFLISKYSPRLEPSAYQKLDAFVSGGGTLVCNYPVLEPVSLVERGWLWTRFYGNALRSTLTKKPGRLTLDQGKGKIILLFGRVNEKRRNILREIQPDVVKDIFGPSAMPVDAGVARGLLSFPQRKAWIFYNTNAAPLTVTFQRKAASKLVEPDGTVDSIAADASTVTLPHGAWLSVVNGD